MRISTGSALDGAANATSMTAPTATEDSIFNNRLISLSLLMWLLFQSTYYLVWIQFFS